MRPLLIEIDQLTIDRGLEVFGTNVTLYVRGVLVVFHFDITRFLVIAKRACEDFLQGLGEFLLWRRLSFTLSSCHICLLVVVSRRLYQTRLTIRLY